MGPEASPAHARFSSLGASEALEQLRTSKEGLSPHEAAFRLRKEGPNRLPRAAGTPLPRQLVRQFTHFFALILWIASALAFVARMPELGWAIALVVLVNGLFSFVQEFRAERAIRALAALLPAQARVRREGHPVSIPADELVSGDVLLLEEGARIAADARVLSSTALRVDQSLLTGESRPVGRTDEPLSLPESVPAVDRSNLIFAGTWVTSGFGEAAVIATGAHTRMGMVSGATARVVRRATPLHVSLNRAVRWISAVSLAVGGAFLAASVMLGMPLRNGLLFAVGVIVALVPEGLLPTLTLSLAMGATRMARRGALVRHLEAVETLGTVSVICTDKTGTLTLNALTASTVWAPDAGVLRASGQGYAPTGAILREGRPLTARERDELAPLWTAVALCGDGHVQQVDGGWRSAGDPIDSAMEVLARKAGVTRWEAQRTAHRERTLPFDARRRRMSTVHVLPTGERLVVTKGSPEVVIPRCVTLHAMPGAQMARETPGIETQVEKMAAEGLRVLAVARRLVPPDARLAPEELEQELELLGLVGMVDPVRPEVPAAIAQCEQAGIRILIVTGDHPKTAEAVARKVGLPQGRILLGSELPRTDDGLERVLREAMVVARVEPERKLDITRALQTRGEVVAMTGDGVNDAPALRQADIGVAMGASGTDVAREAADLVLLDDNFSHVVESVEDGRAAFSNIRRFLTYHLTDNIAELAPFVAWAFSAGRFPLVLSVLQVLALDLGTDVLPALALGAEAPRPAVMREPPRPRGARLLDLRVLGRSFGFLGLIEAVVSLAYVPIGAAVFLGWSFGEPLPRGGPELMLLSTLVFAAIVLMQGANAFECRSSRESLLAIGPLGNRLLVGAVAFEALALLAFVYAPGLSRLLGNRPLEGRQWALLAAAPWVLFAAEEGRKWVVRARASRRAMAPASSRVPAPAPAPAGCGARMRRRSPR